MKNHILKIFSLSLSFAFLPACQPELDAPTPGKGSADFSVYVSLGDGVPAGYSNGAVNLDGQLASFPNVLAKQFALAGGGSFTQPLVPAGVGYGFEKGLPATVLILKDSTFCNGTKKLFPVESGKRSQLDILNFKVATPPLANYNNMAVHGARATYINRKTPWISFPGLGGALGGPDTFWKMYAKDPTNKTVLGEALEQSPTFFTIYLGSTDVFRYAKSGGNQERGPGAVNDDYITNTTVFHDSLRSIISALVAKGAKGAIVNLIDLKSFPYMTYRKYDDLILTSAEAAELNVKYGASDGFTFHEGRNAYVITDTTMPHRIRRILPNEYVLLQTPQDSLYCYGLGGKKPLGQRWVLDVEEIARVNDAVAAYNTIIKNLADEFGLAFVDSNSNMRKNIAGTYYNGIKISTEYASGGIFSLDGLNLAPLGQVTLANLVIEAINKKFGSTIPFASPNDVLGTNYGN